MAELVTRGQGEVEHIADRATFQLRYTSRSKDRTAAVDGLTKLVAAAEPFLDRDGVTVRSRRMSTYDVWDGRRRTSTEAGQEYQLLITDVTVLDDLLNDLIGTEPSHLTGPQWSLADGSTAYREAQAKAVEDARTTALGYADALGARLGVLLRLDDTSPQPGMPRYAAALIGPEGRSEAHRPDMAELSLEPQPVAVGAVCSITWELLA
jgi:uncharacterized protein YggE